MAEPDSQHDVSAEDPQQEGISQAIRQTMGLQDKLRKAISRTSPVNCSADRSLSSLNREREALMLVRDHLEVLENKLRGIRCLESRDLGDKDGCMYDLDTYRRNLLEAGQKVLATASTATGAKTLIEEVLQFVDGGSVAPPMEASPIAPRSENWRPSGSPMSLADLSLLSPVDTSFLNNRHLASHSPVAGVLGERNQNLQQPRSVSLYSQDESHGGKIHMQDFAAGRAGARRGPDRHMTSTMSELYADIGNAGPSGAVSPTHSAHGGEEPRSLRTTRNGETRRGAEPRRPLGLRLVVWLARCAVLAGAGLLLGKNEWVQVQAERGEAWARKQAARGDAWVREQARRSQNKAHLGREMNTGGKIAVPNGLECVPETTLVVWQRGADAGVEPGTLPSASLV